MKMYSCDIWQWWYFHKHVPSLPLKLEGFPEGQTWLFMWKLLWSASLFVFVQTAVWGLFMKMVRRFMSWAHHPTAGPFPPNAIANLLGRVCDSEGFSLAPESEWCPSKASTVTAAGWRRHLPGWTRRRTCLPCMKFLGFPLVNYVGRLSPCLRKSVHAWLEHYYLNTTTMGHVVFIDGVCPPTCRTHLQTRDFAKKLGKFVEHFLNFWISNVSALYIFIMQLKSHN